MSAIPKPHPHVWLKACRVCGKSHPFISEAQWERRVNECRVETIGNYFNRQFIAKLDTLPSYSGPDAETKGGDK